MPTERRFYHQGPFEVGEKLTFDLEARQHLKVLRLNVGDPLALFDGNGKLAYGKFIAPVATQIDRVEHQEWQGPNLQVLLPYLQQSKLDDITRMLTELGVEELLLFPSLHGNPKHLFEASNPKMLRIKKIILESCRQSERLHLMRLCVFQSLSEALSRVRHGALKVAFDARAEHAFSQSFNAIHECRAMVLGPEGGLHAQEIERLKQHDWMFAHWGKHVLRIETAAPVLASQMLF